jgi:photosystem II stability/assembly factor-like uncharacterized protein
MRPHTLFALSLALDLGCGGALTDPDVRVGTDVASVDVVAADRPATDSATDTAMPTPTLDAARADVTFFDGGLPAGTWTNVTSNLAGLMSECGNLPHVSARPDMDMLIAGVAQQGLWATTNGGVSWSRLGTGAGSAMITNRTSWILYDPTNANVFWESGIYNGAGVYRTDNGGSTFRALGMVAHNDSISVDFTDPMRRTLLAGGHEMARTVYRSTDGGGTWSNIGTNLPANAGTCTQPYVLNAQTYLVGCFDYGSPGSIVRTTDGGTNWTLVYTSPVSPTQPLVASDGAIYWARNGNQGLVKSTDRGANWTFIDGRGNISSLRPVELPGGRIAAFGPHGIVVSRDGGTTWSAVTTPAPYAPNGMTYSTHRRAFYIWHFTCGGGNVPVPADAVMAYAYE